ncbi:MAG: hypothetical protein U9R08_03685 [Nanoarchaeota archaeon]|nr:hypothetical protein [Nanoarchaeota archaeon]
MQIKWKKKIIPVGFGVALILAGLAILNAKYQDWGMSALFITAGILLLVDVSWKTLLNKKIEENDFLSAFSAIFGFVMLGAGIINLGWGIIPNIIAPVVPYITMAVGGYVTIKWLFFE